MNVDDSWTLNGQFQMLSMPLLDGQFRLIVAAEMLTDAVTLGIAPDQFLRAFDQWDRNVILEMYNRGVGEADES